MWLYIKYLPVYACIFLQATSQNLCSDIKSDLNFYYTNVTGILQQLEEHVLRLEEKIGRLTSSSNEDSNEDDVPIDCEDVREQSKEVTIESGHYLVGIPGLLKRRIYCNFTEQETWTTISRRINEEDIFNKSWTEYKNGFGKGRGDYWIGNEMLYQLTNNNDYSLRITMTGALIGKKTSSYEGFKVDDEASQYRLYVPQFDEANSNGGDSFFPKADCNKSGNSSAPFSTYDHGDARNCSKTLSGGWWFTTDCGCSNLNGKYVLGGSVPTVGPNVGLYWDTLYHNQWGGKTSLQKVIMEIRRV